MSFLPFFIKILKYFLTYHGVALMNWKSIEENEDDLLARPD